jgi:Tfp pilus assembly protein PilX
MNETKGLASVRPRGRRATSRQTQSGVVVFIALIVLVAMMLAGVATMRSSGSAILTAGNLAFRQNATVAGDLGLEAARTWLTTQGPIPLETTNAGAGYYAAWDNAFDPLKWGEANWEDAAKARQVNGGALDAAGNRVSYVVHRMCALPGPIAGTGAPPKQECVTISDPGKGGPKEAGAPALVGTAQVYYRVTARIEGPKNTVSYVQTMVY